MKEGLKTLLHRVTVLGLTALNPLARSKRVGRIQADTPSAYRALPS